MVVLQTAEMNPNLVNTLTPNDGLTDPGRVLAQPPTDGPSNASSSRKRKATDAPDSWGSQMTKKKRPVAATDVWPHFYGIAKNGQVDRDTPWGTKPSKDDYPHLQCRYCE